MSLDTELRVLNYSQHDGTHLLALWLLATYANDDGVCYPGLELVAHYIRRSERQTRQLLADLEESGELYRRVGTRWAYTKYAILTAFDEPTITEILEHHFGVTPLEALTIAQDKVLKSAPYLRKPPEKRSKVRKPAPENGHSKVLKPAARVRVSADKVLKPAARQPVSSIPMPQTQSDPLRDLKRDLNVRDDDDDLASIWRETIGSPFPDADRASIPAGLDVELWRHACERAAAIFKPRFEGDRIHRAGYVLKCLASIQGEHVAPSPPASAVSTPPPGDDVSEHQVRWTQLLDGLDITPEDRSLWLEAATLLEVAGDRVIVGVPNVFVRDEIDTRFMEPITAALEREFGRTIALDLVIGQW